MVGLRNQQLSVELPPVGQCRIVAYSSLEHKFPVVGLMLVEIPVIDKHRRILDTASFHTDGYVAITEIRVHHVSQSTIFLTMTIHHDTEQFAAPLVCVVIEHLQSDEVIGRRTNIRVEYHEGYTLVICFF